MWSDAHGRARTVLVLQDTDVDRQPLIGNMGETVEHSCDEVALKGSAALVRVVPLDRAAVTTNVPDVAPVTLKVNDGPRYAVRITTIWRSRTAATRRSRLVLLARAGGMEMRT